MSVLGSLGAQLRKMPTTFVLVLIGLFIYFRGTETVTGPEENEDLEPPIVTATPPGDLPANISPQFWKCVYETDRQLSDGMWSDVYYGLQASEAGRVLLLSVSERWQELDDSQRATVVEVVVKTWNKNSLELSLLEDGVGLEKLTVENAMDNRKVATWNASSGTKIIE